MTLSQKIKVARQKAEITVRKKYAQDQLNEELQALGFADDNYEDYEYMYMHIISKYELDDAVVGWKSNTPQQLPRPIEAKRKAAENKINKELQTKFGKAPDTIVYIICDRKMEEMGFAW